MIDAEKYRALWSGICKVEDSCALLDLVTTYLDHSKDKAWQKILTISHAIEEARDKIITAQDEFYDIV